MRLMKTLGVILTTGIISIACSGENTSGIPEELRETSGPSGFVEGEITKIGGNLVSRVGDPESNPIYTLHVATLQGEYLIQIDPTDKGGSPGPQTIYNLAERLEQGMRIKFPTELHGKMNPDRNPMGFSKSRIGMLDPDDIEVLTTYF